MAPIEEQQLGWFRQLGQKCSAIAGDKVAQVLGKERRPWQSFELADAMEQGLAKELTTGLVTPPAPERQLQSFVVLRSKDRSEHILQSETGEALLIARGAPGARSVDIFVPAGGDPPVALGPAFTLSANESNNSLWTLTSNRCECCEYLPPAQACCLKACKREFLHVQHFREDIGGGDAMCMEVEIPALSKDGTPELWCQRRGGAETAEERLSLESRRPTWNKRMKSLTLDFAGMCRKASTKNFQLQMAGVQQKNCDDVRVVFGKMEDEQFALYYKHPFSMAQAFALALSTKDWA